MKAAEEKITFAGEHRTRIKHVIYIIKENRTYDQIFGDLSQDGKPVGNGDPSLTMYGEAITPNLHKLALQFGVLDNFFDSGEVSGDGHVWSTAAIGTDYLEKTWQQNIAAASAPTTTKAWWPKGYPLLQKIPDVNEPASGYLWGNLAAHGKSYYHFGEFISTTFCDEASSPIRSWGRCWQGRHCARKAIAPGEALPAEWGGGVNKWPWPIPLMATNMATKPELVGHFAEESPDFNDGARPGARGDLSAPSEGLARRRRPGQRHHAGLRDAAPGQRPHRGHARRADHAQASVADNDLAVGRAVEAISHSPFWDDTAFFILEDDAQDGGDHVDAHRSLALVVSKYAPHGPTARRLSIAASTRR